MNRRFVSIAALAAGLLTGCGAARPSKYYQLTVPGDAAPAAERSPYPVTLLLGPLRASHLYREDHIVYSSSGENMGTYEYQQWAEPPTEMLVDVLLRELRASGRYRAVDILRSNSHGDYILYGRLYDFKEISASPLMARLTIDLELRETKSGSTVWTHYYSHDEPVSGKDISAVVAALDRNAQRGMGEVKSSLDQYFSTRSLN
ncbi:MAG: ABC-type transport auxiliary lipoprotein family protein [Candidatus Acidiferrales bacterium]